MPTALRPKFLAPHDGRRLQSGPGRDLVFKLTGDDTDGAFDYFVVEVAAHGGPPLSSITAKRRHSTCSPPDSRFASPTRSTFSIPAASRSCPQAPHAFVNLADQPAEVVVVVYTPGGGYRFYAELGPLTRTGSPDPTEIAACFERHDMGLLGPPLGTA